MWAACITSTALRSEGRRGVEAYDDYSIVGPNQAVELTETVGPGGTKKVTTTSKKVIAM